MAAPAMELSRKMWALGILPATQAQGKSQEARGREKF
jgi:hypothetical protein